MLEELLKFKELWNNQTYDAVKQVLVTNSNQRYELGLTKMNNGHYVEAFDIFYSVINTYQLHVNSWYNLALCSSKLKRFEEAIFGLEGYCTIVDADTFNLEYRKTIIGFALLYIAYYIYDDATVNANFGNMKAIQYCRYTEVISFIKNKFQIETTLDELKIAIYMIHSLIDEKIFHYENITIRLKDIEDRFYVWEVEKSLLYKAFEQVFESKFREWDNHIK